MANVLIVDDSAIVRKIARRIIDHMRHSTAEADSAVAALEICSQHMPDVIFLDANMPDVDGCEFLRELRKMPDGGKPKVLFCGLENDVPQIARAMHAGADVYIQKPFDRQLIIIKFNEMGVGRSVQ